MRLQFVVLVLCFFNSSLTNGQNLPVRFEASEDTVVFNKNPDATFLNIYIGEKLFTAFRYQPPMEKPVFYPVYAPSGQVITRGFPINPRPGERVDHPHHVGLWFNYGSINGIDFWNNSSAIPESEKNKYGYVLLQQIIKAQDGKKEGFLDYETEWKDYNDWGHIIERTRIKFSGTPSVSQIDRVSELLAGSSSDTVFIGDNKEGMLAIRMDRAFEEPVTAPEIFTDAQGNPAEVPVLNNEGVNGVYRNSNGQQGGAVWGKRANWVALTAVKEGKKITVAMIDHPSNFGYPAHWHARGYGLFSVNNFGSKVYVSSDPDQSFVLKFGEKIKLRHRILIGDADVMTDSFLDKKFRDFSRSSDK